MTIYYHPLKWWSNQATRDINLSLVEWIRPYGMTSCVYGTGDEALAAWNQRPELRFGVMCLECRYYEANGRQCRTCTCVYPSNCKERR